MDKVPVKVVLTSPDAKLPAYAEDGDAGADLYAIPNENKLDISLYTFRVFDEKYVERKLEPGDYFIGAHQTIMVYTGLKIQLESGWEMQVRSRSGMAKNGLVVANSPGTIDSGYRGQCMVLLHNDSELNRVIKPGTRVAQFVLKRAPQADFQQVTELDDSERGEGGFGSTGTK